MQSRNTLMYLLLVRPYMLHLLMPAFHIKINSHSLFVIEDLTCNQELSLSYKNTCNYFIQEVTQIIIVSLTCTFEYFHNAENCSPG